MTRVKVCGITNLDDAQRAVDLGAWAIGLIFHEPSPRACALPDAEEIGRRLKRAAPEVTGVFVNRPLDEVAAIADACSLSMLQLHGDEGPAYCDEAARRTGCRVMKAAQVHDGSSVRALRAYHVDYHLLDAHHPELRGGTGETFDWELIPAPPSRAGRPLRRPHSRQRRRRDRRHAAVRGRQRERDRGRAREEGPGQARGASSAPSRRPTSAPPHERTRRGAPLRPLRRPLRARDARARARRARGGVARRARRPGVRADARRPAARLRRPAEPAVPREGDLGAGGSRRLAEARGPEPHRRAQDQQRDRPGAAREADGQAARHRGDRRRAARRRRRDGQRAARPRVRRLHGHRGHAPPAAERRADAAARRAGRRRRGRRADAEGGGQRGHPRLGDELRDDALHHRIGGRAVAVPVARARPAARHR